jgi:hypothetical protein
MNLMSWRIVHALLYLIKLKKHANDFWRIRGRVVVFLVDAEKVVGFGRSAIECAAHADSKKSHCFDQSPGEAPKLFLLNEMAHISGLRSGCSASKPCSG